jgi:hypothetical protein
MAAVAGRAHAQGAAVAVLPRAALRADTGAGTAPVRAPSRVVVLVRDAVTGLPLAGAHVRAAGASRLTGADGTVPLTLAVGTPVRVARVGSAPVEAVLPDADTLHVALRPAVSVLPAVTTTATPQPLARAATGRTVREAREAALPTLAATVAALPGVAARSARGEATWQLRGARAEQVRVTLDGMPLNDAASGLADASDLPLALLARVQVVPGADGAAGGGAVGGTIALESGTEPTLTLGAGAFGARWLEGAAAGTGGGLRWRAGGAVRTSVGDFPFVNADGAAGGDTTERRRNNDERRLALFGALSGERGWASAFASATERGLPGAMNVRASDADRSTVERVLLRAGSGGGNWTVAGGVRWLRMRYANGAAPTLDTEARTASPDVEVAVRAGAVALRAGGGADQLEGTALTGTTRARGFLSFEHGLGGGAWRGTAGVRLDAIEGAGALASPWLALEGTGRVRPWLRLGQAFRAPTLYDLVVAAPIRLTARTLRPERATLDAEAGVRTELGGVALTASAFTRTTDDAIIWFPGNFAWSPSNVGRETARGVEASLAWSRGPVTASAWGSLTRSTLDADGLVLPTPYVPLGAGGATLRLASAAGTWTATTQVTGARSFTAAPASAETQLPPVALLDLAWSRDLTLAGRHVLVAAGLANVLDARWESVRRFPSPGRAWTLACTFTP